MKLEISGVIVGDSEQGIYDWFGINATSPKKIKAEIAKAKKNEELNVTINSGGGSVFAGSEIYTLLKSEHESRKLTGQITGMAASAASVIAMAFDNLEMSPTAQLMIHNAATIAFGNKNDMKDTSKFLNQIDKSISNAYIVKTGLSQDKLLDMMNKETWMTAQEALENKFIDKIMFTDEKTFKNDVKLEAGGVLPQSVIDKMRQELALKNKKEEVIEQPMDIDNSILLAKAKLNLKCKL